jgi:hypothetical protein
MANSLGNLDKQSKEIKQLLRIDKPRDTINNELADSLKKPNALFSNKGPCGSIQLEPYPDRYFIAQEFNDNRDDLRKSLEAALERFGYISIVASDFFVSEKLICKIAALIQGTPFGVYQLTTSQNRNVYLELGIAIGLGRPFILVKDKDAEVAKIVSDIEYYQINNYLDVQYELGNLLEKYMASIAKFVPKESNPTDTNNNCVIFHGDAENVDITVTLANYVKNIGFVPVILGKFQEKLANYLRDVANVEPKFLESRDQIVEAIQTSRFGIYRVQASASADNFVALGVSIALNKPFFPIRRVGKDVPSDLSYLSPLEYVGFTDLERKLILQFQHWLFSVEGYDNYEQ